MLATYAFSDPPTTQTTIQGFELATERLPEASTGVLMLSGLLATALIRSLAPWLIAFSDARQQWRAHRRRPERLRALS